MSRNKAIMGENGFVGHFYWIGDDLNQVQSSTVLLESQVWKKKKDVKHNAWDGSIFTVTLKTWILTGPVWCLEEKHEENGN